MLTFGRPLISTKYQVIILTSNPCVLFLMRNLKVHRQIYENQGNCKSFLGMYITLIWDKNNLLND